MWDPKVSEYITALQDLSLLKDSNQSKYRYILTPFLLSYIEASIETVTKETCLKHICHYYLNMMNATYKTLYRVQESDMSVNSASTIFARATPKNEKKDMAEISNMQFCLDYLIVSNHI